MSLQTFSAENRNQMPISLPRRRVQCCSFCRRPGHNITTCTSDRILEFEVICADVVRNFHNQDDFKNWLMQNYINEPLLLKAFVIRKFRMVVRLNTQQYIHYITEYIFRRYKNIPQIESENNGNQNDTNNFLGTALSEFLITLINRTQNTEFETEDINTIYGLREYLVYLSELGASLITTQDTISERVPIVSLVETNEDEHLDEICQCSICWDDKELRQFVKLNCSHEFCKDCITQTLRTETRRNLTCALCRSEISTIASRTQELHDELSENVNP
jgi:hypothetical protein